MEQLLDFSILENRCITAIFGLAAFLALLLAVGGIYAVIAYSVTQRTHEIGIRMALGAERSDVLKLVIGQGLKLVLIGLGMGLLGALLLTRFLSSQLYGVKPTDPLTFIVVPLLLTCIALLGCYIPARRAANVNPVMALRYE
jgi:putative ABC transport system permease protein